MTKINKSPEQLSAEAAAEVRRCYHCGNDYLEGYPHHHATEPLSSYDPMPPKPSSRAGLVAIIKSEYLSEKPHRLHVRQVPSNAEPIGVSQYSAEAAGYVVVAGKEIEVLDAGELGSPPWAPAFHRYVGGISLWDGEMITTDAGLPPWTKNLNGIRRWCGGKHRTWYEHDGKPLCWTLIRLVIGGYSLGRAARCERVGVAKAEELLFGHRDRDCDHVGRCPEGAFDKWWTWTSNDLNGLSLRRVRAA